MPTDFLEKVEEAVRAIKKEELHYVIGSLVGNKNWIFVAGNGGSAAMATHFANDLNKFTSLRAICLSDNIPIISSIGNDIGYEHIFSEQIKKFAEPKDTLIVISSSGNSPNIIRAIKLARKKDIFVIALTGFSGGRAKKLADACIHIPTEKGEYELVESVHGAVLHYLVLCLKNK